MHVKGTAEILICKQRAEEMDYELIRSKRKTACIQIKSDGRVLVRVPNRMPKYEIERFLEEKREWIIHNQKLMQQRQEQKPQVEKLSSKELKLLSQIAQEKITIVCEYYSKLIGVSYNRITIRKQKTRWGSCSAKGNLNFNCLLLLAPEEVLDYVVVHELCHRREMNHSARFWALVEGAMPEYKTHRKWLKEHGSELMARLPDQEKESQVYYTYMLECSDGTFYTGYTNDLDKRLKAHNNGTGAKYTRLRRPVRLVYYEEYPTKEDAMSREALIKQLTRRQKEKLIEDKCRR